MDRLEGHTTEPLLSIARADADTSTRLAALDAASRFPLALNAWREVAYLNFEIVDSEPASSSSRLDALRLAAHIPLLSVRERLRYLAQDDNEPDRGAVAGALDEVGDESRIWAALQQAQNNVTAAYQTLAAMPIEQFLTVEDVPALPDGADPTAAFWRALALARLGAFEALEAFLFGGAVEPDFFAGSPWAAYDVIATVQPVPGPMHEYLLASLARLEAGSSLPYDEERRLRLTVWAATGTADAEGNPIQAPEPPAETPVPAEEEVEARATLPPDFAEALFEDRVEEQDLALLRRVEPGALADVILDVVDAGNARAEAAPDFNLGNAVVRLVGHYPDGVEMPIGALLERQLRAEATALDDEQLAWVLGHESPERIIAEATALIESLDDAQDRSRAIRIVGLTADALTGRAGSPYRGAGGGGVRRMAPAELIEDYETSAAEPPGGPPEPPAAEPEQRRVNAYVIHGGKRRNTFVAGQENVIRCWIGLPEEGTAAAGEAIPPTQIPAEGLPLVAQLKWQDFHGVDHTDTCNLLLPAQRTARSGDCDLRIAVPADERTVQADIAFLFRGRIFEYVRVEAAALAESEAEGPRDSLRIRVVSSQRQVIEIPDSAPAGAAVVVERGATEVEAMVTVFGGSGASTRALSDATQAVRWLNQALFDTEKLIVRQRARRGAAKDVLDTSDENLRVLLRDMARHGAALYNALAGGKNLKAGDRIELLTLEGVYIPLEFVYDRGYPKDNAKICKAGAEALIDGASACPKCTKPLTAKQRTSASTICPFGFWSLSKVIERVPEGEGDADRGPRLDRRTLPPLDSIAFASSHLVPAEERAATVALLKERFEPALLAEDWGDWLEAIERRPALLIIMAHHGIAAGLDYLEIGDPAWEAERGKLNRGQINSVFVNADGREPGPVVLLLGCQTAIGDSTGYIQLSEVFRRERASIVLGTLAEILGPHAGPLARELVTELGTVSDGEEDFGTILVRVRRRLLARGYLLALCIYALGDAEWRLSPVTRGTADVSA